jgi:hypothetical protein
MGGEHDVVKAALHELGTVTFRKVAMQPGMPQGFGVIGQGGAGGVGAKRGVPLFTLPGNPVSAYVSFQLFVRPAIAALQGADDLSLPAVRATLTGPARSPSGRRSYLRGVLDGTKVTPAVRSAVAPDRVPRPGQRAHHRPRMGNPAPGRRHGRRPGPPVAAGLPAPFPRTGGWDQAEHEPFGIRFLVFAFDLGLPLRRVGFSHE